MDNILVLPEKITTTDSSEELIELAKSGRSDAFDRLVNIYSAQIYNYILRMVNNVHDAEDLTQITFIKAWDGLKDFKKDHSFLPWLFVIARRTVLNHLRSHKHQVSQITQDQIEHIAETQVTNLYQSEQIDHVWNCARSLPKKYFEVLWLKYAEGFSTSEISKITGIGNIHVRVLLYRARCLLIKKLKKFQAYETL